MGNATMKHDRPDRKSGTGFIGFVIRFAVATIVIWLTSYFVGGFAVAGLVSALIAALVISIADYLIEKIFRFDAAPLGKGFKGFLVSVIVIYFAQFFVPGMAVTILGAIIGALVIGLIDAILPTRVM